MQLDYLDVPSFTQVNRRFRSLNITPFDIPVTGSITIAIDSTGLKMFGRDEWHQEKHKVNPKRSWRKLHAAIDQDHYFRGCSITDRFCHDDQQVEVLLKQIDSPIDHFTGDGAYDESPVYDAITTHSPGVEIVVPPRKNALFNVDAATQRNRNILEIEENGRMDWQRKRQYGRRNYSELGMQRYKQSQLRWQLWGCS
jgi:hypothetical protein